jgi:maltose O-acetyltransferase
MEMSAKTELEKMLSGELYLASDPHLVIMRQRARSLIRIFNQTNEEEAPHRAEILKILFGGVGSKIVIEPPFYCD